MTTLQNQSLIITKVLDGNQSTLNVSNKQNLITLIMAPAQITETLDRVNVTAKLITTQNRYY